MKNTLKNEDGLKNEDDLRPKKVKTTSKMKTTLKMNTTSKIAPPSPFLKNYLKFFLMTSDLDSHTTTDLELEMVSGVPTGNGIPCEKYNIRDIAHGHRNKK